MFLNYSWKIRDYENRSLNDSPMILKDSPGVITKVIFFENRIANDPPMIFKDSPGVILEIIFVWESHCEWFSNESQRFWKFLRGWFPKSFFFENRIANDSPMILKDSSGRFPKSVFFENRITNDSQRFYKGDFQSHFKLFSLRYSCCKKIFLNPQ